MEELQITASQLGSFATNCYAIYNKKTKEAVLIDPASNARFIYNMIQSEGIKLTAILLTHGHIDHFGGLKDLLALIADAKDSEGSIVAEGIDPENVPVYASREEQEVLADPESNLSAIFAESPVTYKTNHVLDDGDVLELLGTKIFCKLVPGHTKGGMCYYFEENKILFSGDTLFHYSVGRSDFPTGSEEALLTAIEKQLLVLPEDVTVYPGHNDKTTIGKEKVGNPFFS